MFCFMQDLEKALEQKIEQAKADVDDSFRRNLNTASALQALIALIASTHEYISRRESDSASTPPGTQLCPPPPTKQDTLPLRPLLRNLCRCVNIPPARSIGSDQRLTTLFAGPSAHPYLLRESAGLVTKILRILGISTAGMDDLGLGGPGLTATTQQLLDVYESFRACIATHPEMAQVCLMPNHPALPGSACRRACSPLNTLMSDVPHVDVLWC